MSKRPAEEDSELSAWALLTLDEESQAQVQRLFQLLDADKSGTLSQADFADRPQHWAAVCSALTVEPGTATLSLAGFIAGMKRLALRQPCAPIKLPPGRTQSAPSHEAVMAGLHGSLNASLQNACKELYTFCTAPAAAADANAQMPGLPPHFDLGRIIGQGAFGTVRRVTDRASGCAYALKLVAKGGETTLEEVQEELGILRAVGRHPHLVGLHDAFESAVSRLHPPPAVGRSKRCLSARRQTRARGASCSSWPRAVSCSSGSASAAPTRSRTRHASCGRWAAPTTRGLYRPTDLPTCRPAGGCGAGARARAEHRAP